MKYIDVYKTLYSAFTADDVFNTLINTLKPTNQGWDYFINWNKVIENYQKVEIELNTLNTVIGKQDAKTVLYKIFKLYPETIKTIPILLACRSNNIKILENNNHCFSYFNIVFNEKLSPDTAVSVIENTGLLALLQNKKIKSLPDYVIGLEAGLDSNARKNRSGKSMEKIVELFIHDMCTKNSEWRYIPQATKQKIKNQWGHNITIEKANRQIDFAINANNSLFLVETNFYSGGGSKLKSTAGEYKSDYKRWKNDGHTFIWITDGFGWQTAQRPLRETFDETDYILNINMLEKSILSNIIMQEANTSP